MSTSQFISPRPGPSFAGARQPLAAPPEAFYPASARTAMRLLSAVAAH